MLTKRKNSNCDKTQKRKLWKKLKASNCDNLKTQIMTKLYNSNYDKTLKLQS